MCVVCVCVSVCVIVCVCVCVCVCAPKHAPRQKDNQAICTRGGCRIPPFQNN